MTFFTVTSLIYRQFLFLGFFFISASFFSCEKSRASPQDFFTIENIPIEISLPQGMTLVEARQNAVIQGTRDAFSSLIKKLSLETGSSSIPSPASDWDSLIKTMTDQELEAFVGDFEVQKEKMSPVSYQATLTYRFKSDRIYDFFRKKGISLSVPKPSLSKTVLVIPLLKTAAKTYLWEEENTWRILWENGSLSTSDMSLILPIGDLQDMQLVSVSQAEKGDLGALELLAQKYKTTGGVLVIEATLLGTGPAYSGSPPLEATDVKVDFLYGLSPLIAQQKSFSIPEDSPHKTASTRQLLDQAIRKTIQVLNANWMKGTLDQTRNETPIQAQVLFPSQKEWFDIQKALKNLSSQRKIKSFKVDALSKNKALVQIIFWGDPLTTSSFFQEQGLTLTKEGQDWKLLSNGKTQASSPLQDKKEPSFPSSTDKDSLLFDNIILQLS